MNKIANNFCTWLYYNYCTANDIVVDVGNITKEVINRLQNRCEPVLAGGREENENGNGTLMRILPLIVYFKEKEINERH